MKIRRNKEMARNSLRQRKHHIDISECEKKQDKFKNH